MLTSFFQGYDADHKDIELLRLKNFTIGRSINEEEVLSSRFMDRVAELMSSMSPFVSSRGDLANPRSALLHVKVWFAPNTISATGHLRSSAVLLAAVRPEE